METILSDLSISMSEFKKNPAEVLRESGDQPVAVLSHNKPAFYMVSPHLYAAMLEELEDLRLSRLAAERIKQKGKAIEVSLDQL